jgi:hypothetical protein
VDRLQRRKLRNLLLELYAFVGDVLTFYQDNQARESRIATATQRKNLIALTKLLGFRPAGARAATADALFRLAVPPAAPVTIRKGTRVRTASVTEPLVFQLMGDVLSPPRSPPAAARASARTRRAPRRSPAARADLPGAQALA